MDDQLQLRTLYYNLRSQILSLESRAEELRRFIKPVWNALTPEMRDEASQNKAGLGQMRPAIEYWRYIPHTTTTGRCQSTRVSDNAQCVKQASHDDPQSPTFDPCHSAI